MAVAVVVLVTTTLVESTVVQLVVLVVLVEVLDTMWPLIDILQVVREALEA
jgi:hypothetical protein